MAKVVKFRAPKKGFINKLVRRRLAKQVKKEQRDAQAVRGMKAASRKLQKEYERVSDIKVPKGDGKTPAELTDYDFADFASELYKNDDNPGRAEQYAGELAERAKDFDEDSKYAKECVIEEALEERRGKLSGLKYWVDQSSGDTTSYDNLIETVSEFLPPEEVKKMERTFKPKKPGYDSLKKLLAENPEDIDELRDSLKSKRYDVSHLVGLIIGLVTAGIIGVLSFFPTITGNVIGSSKTPILTGSLSFLLVAIFVFLLMKIR